VITPPAQTPTAGIPANFTFAVTAAGAGGSAIRSLIVDWGDGSTQNLGAVTGNAVVSHTFAKDGTYVVTGTVTDASGNTVAVSTVVFIQVAPPLTVSLGSQTSGVAPNAIVTFTATVTGLGTSVAQNFHWEFGDGTAADDTSSNQDTHTYTTAGAKPARVTVTTSTGATASGSRTVTIN